MSYTPTVIKQYLKKRPCMIMQVHDELVFEVPELEREEIMAIVK